MIFDNNEIIGFVYIIKYDSVAYLMYFAVDENKRSMGYGSKVLDNLIKKYKTVILSIERVNENLIDNKMARKNFYLRNGFFESNKFIEDNGVEYEILCSNNDYDITKDILEKRYIKMTNSKIIRFMIKKKFNVNNIDFIN